MWETTGWNHKKCDSFTSSSLSLSLLFLWICPQVWRGHGWNLPDSSPPPISKAFNFGLRAPLWLWVWGHNKLRIILKQHICFVAPAMFKTLCFLLLSGNLRQSLCYDNIMIFLDNWKSLLGDIHKRRRNFLRGEGCLNFDVARYENVEVR